LSDTTFSADRLVRLARAQSGAPGDWSLATDIEWLTRAYAAPGVVARFWELLGGELRGSAALAPPSSASGLTRVTSMLRSGDEVLWGELRSWIEATLENATRLPDTRSLRVQAVSEALTEDEVTRWASLGFDLVFEELAMERDLTAAPARSAPWPAGTRLMNWDADAAALSFVVFEAAFRDRPGFPGWSRPEWTERLTGGHDFLPGASFCALIGGTPVGFVVSRRGWIDQVGVAPTHRRRGLAIALVAEATSRMRAQGMSCARLHVNTNNPGALAAWRALGWGVVGRRGRFERGAHPR
jgi:ribosomal protein S18 acetylase RimI-like enzyme